MEQGGHAKDLLVLEVAEALLHPGEELLLESLHAVVVPLAGGEGEQDRVDDRDHLEHNTMNG